MEGRLSFLVLVILLSASFPQVTCTDDVSLQSLLTLVQQQAATVQQQAATIQTLQAGLSSLQATVQQQAATDQQLSASVARLTTRVFFTSYIDVEPVQIGDTSPIVFDIVVTNIGNAYNSRTGVFTAPVSGVYVFYTQIRKRSNNPAVNYGIYQEGTILCHNVVDDAPDYDKSSCLATAHVLQGETVIVRRESGDTVIQGWGAAFSGYLASMD